MSEVDRVALLLMVEWERVEGKPVNPSFVATFADMARAVLASDWRAEQRALGAEQALTDLIEDASEFCHLNHVVRDCTCFTVIKNASNRRAALVRAARPEGTSPPP